MADDSQDNGTTRPGARAVGGRSGSETRQRQDTLIFRVKPDERAAIEAAAGREGMSVGGYIRTRVLALPTTRVQLRPTADAVALAKVQRELNRIGGHTYQLVRHVNFGRLIDPHDEIGVAYAGFKEAVAAILAMRRACGPQLPEPDDDRKAVA